MKVDHLKVIEQYWNSEADAYCRSHPEHREAAMHPSWGLWNIPEATIGILANDLKPGVKLIELGCGDGHDAAGYAEHGAVVLGVDISANKLKHAVKHAGVQYIQAPAECLPVDSGTIDIVVSDHGAFDHSPPSILLSEVGRVLRPGGALAICTYSPLALACFNPTSGRVSPTLIRHYPTDTVRYNGKITTVEWSYAGWITAFSSAGFSVERLEELRCEPDSKCYFDEMVDNSWGSRWPCDILWLARKSGQRKAC